MGKIRKQKTEAARIYSLPADYLRQSRYTAFLQSRRTDRVMLCWYIGDETGLLAGVYQSQSEKYPIVDLYNFVGEKYHDIALDRMRNPVDVKKQPEVAVETITPETLVVEAQKAPTEKQIASRTLMAKVCRLANKMKNMSRKEAFITAWRIVKNGGYEE